MAPPSGAFYFWAQDLLSLQGQALLRADCPCPTPLLSKGEAMLLSLSKISRVILGVVLTLLNVRIGMWTVQTTLGETTFPLVLALIACSVVTLAQVWRNALA
jgi:hypothetical protein